MAMDADITLEENAVKKMIEYMETHPEICANMVHFCITKKY